MKVKERHFPYPVLADFSNDFIHCSYDTDVTYTINQSQFLLTIKHSLNNIELAKLISDGDAKFSTHIECSRTQLRMLDTTDKLVETVSIDASKIEKEIEVCTFIIANNSIPSYKNDLFHSDYEEYNINLNKGDILAIGNDYNIVIEKEKVTDSESIIQLVINGDVKAEPFSMLYNSDKIVVKLNERNFFMYNVLAEREEITPVLHSLIAVPVISSALQIIEMEVDQDESGVNEGDYSNYRWFSVLLEKIRAIGLDPMDSNIYEDTIGLTHKILDDPLSKSLDKLNNFYDSYLYEEGEE